MLPPTPVRPSASQGSAFVRVLAATARRVWSWLGRDPYLWLVVSLSLLAAAPLAAPGYFMNAHDAPHTVFFLTEFDAALRDGVWYPAWATDQALGYGYPTFSFYSPLAYYAAEAFHLLGATKVAAVKWVWAAATLGGGLAMYAYGRRAFGRAPGLLAAVVYVYVPYHLLDMYVRAALAEYSAFVWMPLALLAFHQLADRASARSVAAAGLAYGALWLTHHMTAAAFTPLLAAYVLFRLVAGRSGWRPLARHAAGALAGALLGLGLAAALLLPSLGERGFVNQAQWVQDSYNYAKHFSYPAQLFSAFWGYQYAVPGPADGMSFQLGAVPAVLAAAAAAGALRRPAARRAPILFFAAATLGVVLLMLPVAEPAWQALPIAALVQFPWRLLALSAVTLAVLAGQAVWPEPAPDAQARSGLASVSLCLLVAVLGSWGYAQPEHTELPAGVEQPLLTIDFETTYPDMVGMTAWVEELPPDSPLVAQYRAGGPLVTAEALAPGAQIEMIRAAGASDELWVRSPAGTALRFWTYYYPGWRVYVDGRRLPDSALRPEGPYALLTVDVAPGEHRVLLRWGDTPLRAAGKAVTLGCLALSLGLLLWRRR